MPGYSEFDKYLSREALMSMSLRIDGTKSKDLDQKAYVLFDGTIITIEKNKDVSNKNLEDVHLENPYGIRISNPSMLTVTYMLGDEEKQVRFIAKSIPELCTKWQIFKNAKGFDCELPGTISAIGLTEEQKLRIIDMEDCMNDIINIMTDDNLELCDDNPDDPVMNNRYGLISSIITNIAKNVLLMGYTDKIHLPHMVRGSGDEPIEVREYLSQNDIFYGEAY